MSTGWYKQQRSIVERPWFKDANVVQLYTYLKSTAYVADGKYGDVVVRRGSCPTTRAEMMEATGLSYKKVDICLKKLINNGEILVKGYNKFTIVTICDYDACSASYTFFDDEEVQQRYNKGTTKVQQDDFPPIYNIKEDNNIYNNLISHNMSYKKERENNDVALEIKKRYNQEFKGMLPPCVRLSTSTHIAVMECLRRFGRQSVDEVFSQIKREQFSLGSNKTGFIANFTFIFTPKNYQNYLERAKLSRQKKEQQETRLATMSVYMEPQLTKVEREEEKDRERRDTLQGLVDMANREPGRTSQPWMPTLLAAYELGELAKYGIAWEPSKQINPINTQGI